MSIPAPDPALPPSFDSNNPSHRFRFLESANQVIHNRHICPLFGFSSRPPLKITYVNHALGQWMVRPIVEAHGWDHESGIEGFSVDKAFMIKNSVPANVNGQVTLLTLARPAVQRLKR